MLESTKNGDLAGRLAQAEEDLAMYRAAIRMVAEVCGQAAVGNLEPRLLHIKNDDLGHMMGEINHLLDLTDAFVRESSVSLSAAAAGNYHRKFLERGMLGSFQSAAAKVNRATEAMEANARILEDERAARVRLVDELESTVLEIVSSVAAASTQVRSNAEGLLTVAGRTSDSVDLVTNAAEEVTSTLSHISEATGGLTATISNLARQATESSTKAQEASDATAATNKTMSGLSEASLKISSVIRLITEVAGQTRLLALNANIEAARAGAAGKGFAVVASEVKGLATQTAEATGEIEDQVGAIQSVTQEAAESIEAIGKTVVGSAKLATTMEASIADQRDTASEISQSLSAAVERTRDVAASLTTVTDGTHNTRSAAEQMLEAADELSRLAELMHSSVSEFLDRVRKG
ncbi:MAG: methyl-accepting chemotaxis protein [Sandaracinaceae bacterium]